MYAAVLLGAAAVAGCATGQVDRESMTWMEKPADYEHQLPPAVYTGDPTTGRPHCERMVFRYEAKSAVDLDARLKDAVLYGAVDALVRVRFGTRSTQGAEHVYEDGRLAYSRPRAGTLLVATGVGITWGDCPK